MSSALSTFASATPFAEELSRPPKQPYALSSAAADKTHALYSAANVPGSRAIQRGDSKSHALYSAANVPSSRAIQRGDGQAIRAIQRGKRTKLTRYTARRQQKPIALYSAANVGSSRARQRGGSTRLTRYPARGLPSDVDDADDELSLFSAGLFDFSTNACSFAFSLFSDCFSPTAFS